MFTHKLKKVCICIFAIFLIRRLTIKSINSNSNIIIPTSKENYPVSITSSWFIQKLLKLLDQFIRL